jgi:hypothetical protein
MAVVPTAKLGVLEAKIIDPDTGLPIDIDIPVAITHVSSELDQGASLTGLKGNLTLSSASAAEPVYGEGQARPPSLTLTGRLRVDSQKTTSVMNHSQVTVTTTATVIVASNTARLGGVVKNIGSVDIYVGGSSSVTVSNGYRLKPDEELPSNILTGYTSTLYGIVASGTGTAAVLRW